MATVKTLQRQKVKQRVRKKILGTTERPRLSVYRSNKEIYAQVIDDSKGVTLASASSRKLDAKGTKLEVAKVVGKAIGEQAASNGITEVVFDRNGYVYHGRVKNLAEGAREGGLKF